MTSLTRRGKVPLPVWSPLWRQSCAEHREALALLAADLLPAGKGRGAPAVLPMLAPARGAPGQVSNAASMPKIKYKSLHLVPSKTFI